MTFEVLDTGPGVPADDQQRIFQPFFQSELGIAKGEGTGLGLAISLEYAHLMGGTLEVKSPPGQGSVFILRVPLPQSAAPTATASPGRVIGLADGEARVRVLVVDDEADNRELARQFLKDAGFEVRTADNGAQAVQAFQRWQPAFIWMDMRMPVLDGYGATRQIRALPGGEKVKIVALTASAFEEDRAAILDAGCDDMIKKPFDESRLFAVMGNLLGLRLRYESEDTHAAPASDKLTDLSTLAPSLRTELGAAAEMLDLEAVRTLIERIRATEPALATGLDALVADFRFDTIGALCAHP
jgi:CheY-like chemotaxis protein